MNGARPRKKAPKNQAAERLSLWKTFVETGQDEGGKLPVLLYPEYLGVPSHRQAGLGPPEIPITFAEQAEMALRLPLWEPLKTSFQTFGLDPTKPLAWRLLLHIFSEVHFGSHPPNRGAPKKWSHQRFCELLRDVGQIQAGNFRLSDVSICKTLKTDQPYKSRYQDVGAATLRRNLQYAKNPKHNEWLKTLAKIYAEEEIKKAGKITSADESAIKRRALDKALRVISTPPQLRDK